MQQFRREDIVRGRLNSYISGETPFTEIIEVGPDMYQLSVIPNTFSHIADLFPDSRDAIRLGPDLSASIVSVGYNSEGVRYIQIELTETTSKSL